MLDDEVAVHLGEHILWWALGQRFVVDTIEAVAEVLHKKKVMLGEELRKMVFDGNPDLTGTFTRKEVEQETFRNGRPKVLTKPDFAPFKFLGVDLVVCSFLAKMKPQLGSLSSVLFHCRRV